MVIVRLDVLCTTAWVCVEAVQMVTCPKQLLCFLIKSMDSGAKMFLGSVPYLSPYVRKNNGLAKMPTSK